MTTSLPQNVQRLLRAEGIEAIQPAYPDGLVMGKFGWSGTFAGGVTLTGTVIDFSNNLAFGAGVVAQTGRLLRSLVPQTSNRKAVVWPEWVKVEASANAATLDGGITQQFLQDLNNKLYIAWTPPGVKPRPYSLIDAVGTVEDNNAVAADNSGAAYQTRILAKSAQPSDTYGAVVDLEYDQFELVIEDNQSITVPANLTDLTFNVIFYGGLYAKAQGDVPRLVGSGGCASPGQKSAIQRRANLRAMMAMRPQYRS